MSQRPQLIIGVGNPLRGDDGVGWMIAAKVKDELSDIRVVSSDGEPTKLISLWQGYDDVLVMDAVCTGSAEAGSIHFWEVSHQELPAYNRIASSHILGLHEAIELARALGSLPRYVAVVGIEAAVFDYNAVMSESVMLAADTIAKNLIVNKGVFRHA